MTLVTHALLANHLTKQSSYQKTLHFHDINEIIFTLNNQCSFFLGTKTSKISRGSLILIPEGTIHRKFNPSDLAVDTYTIHYSSALLSAYSTPATDLLRIYGKTAAFAQLPEDKIDLATGLFERCLQTEGTAFGSDLRRHICFLELLLEFHAYFEADAQNEAEQPEEGALVAALIGYIEAHLSQRLTLDQLAAEFFTSKYNLCRVFKRETGFTIVEYINSNRIRLACSILREGKHGYDVGEQVGFSNRSHFIRTFQQLTGMTPGSYARQYRNRTNAPAVGIFTPHGDAL